VTKDLGATEIAETLVGKPSAVVEAMKPTRNGGLPAEPGFYAWWADSKSIPGVPECPHPSRERLDLFYVGISPATPSSAQTIRSRVLGNHLSGNLGSSTFRFTLAALLRETLSLRPGRTRTKVVLSKQENDLLTSWQREHLHLTWCPTLKPWVTESKVIAAMAPPLNLAGNAGHPFHATLTRARKALREAALPKGGVAL
jgi:hypothetical protein